MEEIEMPAQVPRAMLLTKRAYVDLLRTASAACRPFTDD
jgi:hypothetical protein